MLGVRNTRLASRNGTELPGLSLSLVNCVVSMGCSDNYTAANSCSSMPKSTQDPAKSVSKSKEVIEYKKKSHKSSGDVPTQKCSNLSSQVAKICAMIDPVHIDSHQSTASSSMLNQLQDVLLVSHAVREVDVDDSTGLRQVC